MAETKCRCFNGYKPCSKSAVCERARCVSFSEVRHRLLIVHLEAMGAVLRSTSLLSAIHRKYPGAHITWVTREHALPLITGLVDRALSTSNEDLLKLSALSFDVALVIDKSLAAWGVVRRTEVAEVFGFRADPACGAIVPANPEARELWELGLDDHKKFFVNRKAEQRLVHEALALGAYVRDEYRVSLSAEELRVVDRRRAEWRGSAEAVIGINTGCSPALPAKKMSVAGHRRLLREIAADPVLRGLPVVLLGGPEDHERNLAIADGAEVILSPCGSGLRDGLCSVAACDLVFSGDSLGMHMAIALRKWVVAWFGPSCPQEIDLYDRGVKVNTRASCSPCWKRVCDKPVMCYDQVDYSMIVRALSEGFQWHISSSKPHFPEIFSSPSL